MTKEQIQKEINEMNDYVPVSKIEENLKIPPTTLQKVLKGNRELPKKWFKVLEAYFNTPKNAQENQNKPHTDIKKEKTINPVKSGLEEMESLFQEELRKLKIK